MQKILLVTILILGAALCVILALIGFTQSVENAAGVAHPDFFGMRIGGDGLSRAEPIAILALIFQIVALAQVACLVALGVNESRRTPLFFAMLTVSFLATVYVWWEIFASHQAYLNTGEIHYVLGFPTPTAWVVYAIWLSGLSYVLLYVFGFKRYIWSDEDEQSYNKLLQDYPKTD